MFVFWLNYCIFTFQYVYSHNTYCVFEHKKCVCLFRINKNHMKTWKIEKLTETLNYTPKNKWNISSEVEKSEIHAQLLTFRKPSVDFRMLKCRKDETGSKRMNEDELRAKKAKHKSEESGSQALHFTCVLFFVFKWNKNDGAKKTMFEMLRGWRSLFQQKLPFRTQRIC